MKLVELFESRKESKRADGAVEIHNPTIMDVERGNMVRVNMSHKPAHKNFQPYPRQKDWGQMVVDVDYKSGLVLVGEYLGGKKRFTEWVPVDAIDVTWNIGGYEKAMDLLDQFSGAVKDTIRKREDLEQDSDIEKHVKFKR